MADHPGLNHLDIATLRGAAGGDPWELDETLQGGDPGQIAELSRAFFNAGHCTSESYADFVEAQARFRAAWNRETGEHPINDGAEVRRALHSLTFQHEQLPLVAATLAGVGAALAEAQRSSSREISVLDAKLRHLDELIGRALTRRVDPSALAADAVESTRSVLGQVRSLRDGYAADLDRAMTTLRLDCNYDPAIEALDGNGASGSEHRGWDAVDYYRTNRRSADEALIRSGSPEDPEMLCAAGRLADYAVATNPYGPEDARVMATERLDDFRMAQFVGPLPEDPVLGGDARARARSRLELQSRLEAGAFGLAPMSREEATRQLDHGEHFGRIAAVQQAAYGLTRCGISGDGARSIVWDWARRGSDIADKGGLAVSGVEEYAAAMPTGLHAKPSLLSAEDAAKWGRIAGRAGTAGNVVQLGIAVAELTEGGDEKFEEFGGAVGGFAGGSAAGWGAAAVAGSFTGPWTSAAIIVAASFLGSEAGSEIGGGIGSHWDRTVVTGGKCG